MAESTSGKVCVLCGEDCSTQPRVKDSHGNYYHKTCHEMAAEKKRQRRVERESRAARPDERDPLDVADDEHAVRAAGDSGMDEAMRGMRLDDSDDGLKLDEGDSAAPRARPRPKSEPSPAAEASNEPVYDILEDSRPRKPQTTTGSSDGDDDEGFNLLAELADEQAAAAPPATASSGLGLEPAAPPAAPPTMAGMAPATSARRSVWPAVIGILAMVFGGLWILSSLWRAVMILGSAGGAQFAGMIIGLCIALLLAIWQFQGGLGTFRREQAGAMSLRKWGITMSVLVGTCGSLAIVGTALGTAAAQDEDLAALGDAALAVVITTVAIMLAWPLFVAIWLSRGRIQSEIEGWD